MTSLLTILINWAPLLIIAGIWIFFMNRWQARARKVMGGPPAPMMTINLPAELVEFIEREIRAGQYVSADDMIRTGLRELRREKLSSERRSPDMHRGKSENTDEPFEERTR
jgi:putative addiction module CopG family antidote